MTAALIDVAHRGRVAIVTLRRPPANAMNLELTEEIAAVFKALRQENALGAVILTGQGKSFCAGVDLKSVPSFNEADQRRKEHNRTDHTRRGRQYERGDRIA